MNLIVIHGNGLSAIANKILLIKKDFDPLSVVELSGKNIHFEQALMELSTQQLFSQSRLVIMEDFDEKINFKKLPEDPKLTVVFRFSKNLGATSEILKFANLKTGQIINLTERDETNVFPFLDKLGEKDKGAFLEFDKLYKNFGGQYLLTMIFYLFRRLVQAPKGPDFVVKKIQKQKRNFGLLQIRALYELALKTDFKVKCGLMEEKTGLTLLIGQIITI